jgi:hypothetical protein
VASRGSETAAGPADVTGEDPFWEIGSDHPKYGYWRALSTPGEDPRPMKDRSILIPTTE